MARSVSAHGPPAPPRREGPHQVGRKGRRTPTAEHLAVPRRPSSVFNLSGPSGRSAMSRLRRRRSRQKWLDAGAGTAITTSTKTQSEVVIVIRSLLNSSRYRRWPSSRGQMRNCSTKSSTAQSGISEFSALIRLVFGEIPLLCGVISVPFSV